MNSIKRWTLCKALAIVLSLLIAGEASVLMAAQGSQQDPLEAAFNQGREAYFAEKYEDAKNILEKLVSDLAAIEGRDSFKGKTYLWMGATYEQLKLKELAIKYFCRSKAILGEVKTVEGLDLKTLKYYNNDCTSGAGVIAGQQTTVRRRGFLGGLLGTLLFLSIVGAGAYLLWKYVIKKDDGGGSNTTVYKSSCFSTEWQVTLESTWEGSLGEVTFSPLTAPNPNENNGWTDSMTYTLTSSGGGTLKSIKMTLSITLKGGDNGTRHDQAWIDNVLYLDETNTFSQSCNTPGAKDYSFIYTRDSLGQFTLRHSVKLSNANSMQAHIKVVKK